jgi:hypothetical protein
MRSSPLVTLTLSFTLGLLACGARTDPLDFDTSGAGGDGAASASSGTGGTTCSPELCNGIDDDCDGQVDEESPTSGADCLTGQPGQCGNGTVTCQNGSLACIPDNPPKPEDCDGVDNDCNGVIDDGCAKANGCSDNTREGFVDQAKYPDIAACAGGWAIAGVVGDVVPACGLAAGNTSPNPGGAGCSAADLCSPGFHVCKDADEVAARSPTGCAGAATGPGLFFATGQGSTGCAICALGASKDPGVCNGCSCASDCATTKFTANDLFGCGTFGFSLDGCGVLDRTTGNLCSGVGSPWTCGSNGCDEANQVAKPGPAGGGVLCCAN